VAAIAVGLWRVRRPEVAATVLGRSIGVTTFVNISGARGNDYFSEGMTQEIADAP